MEDKYVLERATYGSWLKCSGAYTGRHEAIDRVYEKGSNCFGTAHTAMFSDEEGYVLEWYISKDNAWLLPHFKKEWTDLVEKPTKLPDANRDRVMEYMMFVAGCCNNASKNNRYEEYGWRRVELNAICTTLSDVGVTNAYNIGDEDAPIITEIMVGDLWEKTDEV